MIVETKSKQFNVRLTPSEDRALGALERRDGLRRTDIVRRLLRDAVHAPPLQLPLFAPVHAAANPLNEDPALSALRAQAFAAPDARLMHYPDAESKAHVHVYLYASSVAAHPIWVGVSTVEPLPAAPARLRKATRGNGHK